MPHLFHLGCGFTFSHSLVVFVLDVALVPALHCTPPIVQWWHSVVTWIKGLSWKITTLYVDPQPHKDRPKTARRF